MEVTTKVLFALCKRNTVNTVLSAFRADLYYLFRLHVSSDPYTIEPAVRTGGFSFLPMSHTWS